MNEEESSFPRRWTIANTLALLMAYILYTPIAHGLSGAHPRGLSTFQVVMHSMALAIVAASVAFAQRSVRQTTEVRLLSTGCSPIPSRLTAATSSSAVGSGAKPPLHSVTRSVRLLFPN